MKKTITTITLGILMLASAMAVAMYGGESYSFETNFTNPVYTVTGNSSNLEGLNITLDNGNITISPAINYKPDNFTLIFFDNITNEVIKTVTNNVYHGGGSRTEYVDKNVTVYIPEYINQTVEKEVEVEKVVDNLRVISTGYKLWQVLLGMFIGIGFGWFICKDILKKDGELYSQKSQEMKRLK